MYRFLVLLAIAAAAAPGAAQRRTLLPGDEVQVRAPAVHQGPFRGAVVRYVQDTLAVLEHGTDSVHAVPLREIRYLSRNEGPDHGRSVRRGLQAGAFVGMALGVVAGPLLAAKYGDDGDFGRYTALSGASGLAAGGGLGALIGTLFAGDHWQRFLMAPPVSPCGAAPCPPPPPAAQAAAPADG